MAHILANLRGMNVEKVKKILKADDLEQVLFLFRVQDLSHAKQFIEKVHTKARKENPEANLGHMTFLEEK
jgi:hypothetical protein